MWGYFREAVKGETTRSVLHGEVASRSVVVHFGVADTLPQVNNFLRALLSPSFAAHCYGQCPFRHHDFKQCTQEYQVVFLVQFTKLIHTKKLIINVKMLASVVFLVQSINLPV